MSSIRQRRYFKEMRLQQLRMNYATAWLVTRNQVAAHSIPDLGGISQDKMGMNDSPFHSRR
jgi:hypothetical protein